MALPQGHTQSSKIRIDVRLLVFVQVSAILSFEALLSHLTCNRNYWWSTWQLWGQHIPAEGVQVTLTFLVLMFFIKVCKGAKISNRYNQVPHLAQDTNGKVTNSQLITTNESQKVSPFPAGDHKAHINRCSQHTGQCKRTGGCYNELVVAFFSTGGCVKGKKIYTY